MKSDNDLIRESAAQLRASEPKMFERILAYAARKNLLLGATNVRAPLGAALESRDGGALETIVNKVGRPVLLVTGTKVDLDAPEAEIWKDSLSTPGAQAVLTQVIPAVGRIEVENFGMDWVGTGWLATLDEGQKTGILVTNRHVAQLFAGRGSTAGSGFTFRRGQLNPREKMSARVDFREEHGDNETSEFKIVDILHIEGEAGPDMAFLKVEPANKAGEQLPTHLRLSDSAAQRNQYVATVGYPAYDSRLPDAALVKRLFGDVYDVKRFAPGQIIDGTRDEVTHNCSTLGGNSGSPIFDLASGAVVGLHFSGLYLRANYGVPAALLRVALEKIKRGVQVAPGGIGNDREYIAVAAGEEPGATAPARAVVTVNIPLRISVDLGAPTPVIAGAAPAATRMELSAAVRQVRERLVGVPSVLEVREGFAFADGWITDQRAVVVVLRDSEARTALPLMDDIGGFPIEIRDPGPVDFLPAAAATAEAVRRTAYKKPTAFSLAPVTAKMKITCHLSPDAGWPTLHAFLRKTKQRLTIGMYDFSARHIVEAVKTAVGPNPRTLDLVLEDHKDAIGGTGVKRDDIADTETEKILRAALKNRFQYASASVGTGRQFASAYHIKVAVRDGTAFWLSSGNWQSSNQNSDPVDTSSWSALTSLNREWHVIVENDELANQFEQYLRYDLENALNDKGPRLAPEGVNLLVEDVGAEEAVPTGKPTYHRPLDVERTVTVRPLLTPDNYQQETLDLINSAEEQILFQNQSFSLLLDKQGNDVNDPRFGALADALLRKQKAGVDVRIIIRGDFNPQTPLERLKLRGFDMTRVRVQSHCHTKGIVVDGTRVLVGSHNWTNEGALVNRDASLIIEDMEIAKYFAEAFWGDWKKLARPSVGRPRRVRAASDREATPATGFQLVSLAEFLA